MSQRELLDLGLVVATHGRHAIVRTPDGERLLCHLRGKKSEVVVGDQVRWQPAGDEGVIEHIEPRRNLLLRRDAWKTKSFAANLDQILILVAGEPMFSEAQLTRALIAAEQADIPALVGLNKIDLPAAAVARERLAPYRAMGVELLELSLKREADASRQRLHAALDGRTTLVLGPSGTGKSTLINLLVPRAEAEVGEISSALNSGRHTTTATRWYALGGDAPDAANGDADHGALIDSPGFQEFGLHHVEADQLAALMPDLRAQLGGCRFYNCTHRQEPGCAVLAAVARGDVSRTRHALYAELYDELSATRW